MKRACYSVLKEHFVKYHDRYILAVIIGISLAQRLQVIAIVCGLLIIVGIHRFAEFLSNMLTTIEKSERGEIAGVKWELHQRGALPDGICMLAKERLGTFSRYFNRGYMYFRQGNTIAAIKEFEKAEEIDPQNFDVHVMLGLFNNVVGENEASIFHSKKALKIKPEAFVPQFNMAVATNHLLGYSKSLPLYLEAEKYANKEGLGQVTVLRGKLNLFIGHDHRDSKDFDKARKCYLKAKEILEKIGTEEAKIWLKHAVDNFKIVDEAQRNSD